MMMEPSVNVVLTMTSTVKQIAFSLAFAIITVAVTKYISWVLNGSPT